MKTIKGFLDGLGGSEDPSGRVTGLPANFANADGVNEVASAGGGRPVSFAINVLIHLIKVKIPKIDPSVSRKFENCSATDTMAYTR